MTELPSRDVIAGADPAADPVLQDLVRAGNSIAAMKRYQALTNVGLAEAKAAVQRLMR